MAKKPKSDNFDALGSVYDFLFTEAKKKPEKRRPIKPTEVSGTSMMTDAVFAALEKPGAFISNTIVDEFNGALDLELGVVQFDTTGKFKITSNSLVEILKDPQKAVEKSIAKNQAIRKSMRATYLREFMKDFVATGWARKYGDIEAQKAVYGSSIASRQRLLSEESYAVAKAIGQYSGGNIDMGSYGKMSSAENEFLHKRSLELVRRKMIPQDKWDSLSEQEKASFREAFLRENSWKKFKDTDVPDTSLQQFLNARFGTEGAGMYQRYIDTTDKDVAKRNIADPKKYLQLETAYLDENIKSLENITNRNEQQQRNLDVYRKTKYLLDKGKGEAKLRTELERIRTDLRSVTDPTQKRLLERELKDTRTALRYISGDNLMGRIGKWEGYVNSWNMIYGPKGSQLFQSVLTGDFFDAKKNTIFCPTKVSEIDNRGGKIEIMVGATSPRGLINAYNQMGTQLYYMTPRSVFRTLFYNGEGFTYLLFKKLEKEQDLLKTLATGLGEKDFKTENLLGLLINKDMNTFLTDNASKFSPEDLEKIKKFFESNKNFSSVIKVFSTGSRIQQIIQSRVNAITAPIRRKIAEKFLMKFVSKYGGAELLNQWIMKGGINVMVRSLATGIAGALGLVATPLGSAIITAITWVLTDLAMKAFAQMLIVGKYILFGLIGIVFLVIFWASGSVKSFNKNNFSYYNETPGSIIQCSLYEERDLGTGDEAPWGDTIIPPPSGESCVFGAGSFWCSQGYKDTKGWSHQNINHLMPVDLTSVGYIYAPQFCSTGNCSITRIAVINCRDGSNAGGIVELTASNGSTTYLFKLLHVKPLAGLGEKLSGGQPVAVVQDRPEVERGWCWTGKHLHLETRQNGATVDPLKLLQSFSCNVPDESSCARP
ncbi:hypothetical protein CVU76_00680 [Candidatus Dojkabacteria bacterium HGW-Dojkabacteria-1]|uniref:Uncharacterized protein n=1 Tax=Candidatus Dojkabacteria bacterium HGW-Dojkabacteria-1 TaxID=2013761 RepID=A0A2N2F2T7_9BACT|nr:MAG: hypothetical protein CVU76_00680 [Candidatus Dojkabacteria bacterium HGW-Dojkabacteria-1]